MLGLKTFLSIIIYFGLAISCIIVIKRLTANHPNIKILLLSICYTAFFGIGFIGSSGGFIALPFPIFGAAVFYVWEWSPWIDFIEGVMFPFVFWWIIILIIMLIRNKIKAENSVNQL